MTKDIAELQTEAIARGYTRDYGTDAELPNLIAGELRLVGSVSSDLGTDPGDDVTIYLIEGSGQKGYMLLPGSFHADPLKAAWIAALQARH